VFSLPVAATVSGSTRPTRLSGWTPPVPAEVVSRALSGAVIPVDPPGAAPVAADGHQRTDHLDWGCPDRPPGCGAAGLGSEHVRVKIDGTRRARVRVVSIPTNEGVSRWIIRRRPERAIVMNRACEWPRWVPVGHVVTEPDMKQCREFSGSSMIVYAVGKGLTSGNNRNNALTAE